MAELRAKDNSGYIVFPDTFPTVDVTNVLHSESGGGNKTYTATQPCIAIGYSSGAYAPTFNGVAYNQSKSTDVYLYMNKGDTIVLTGNSNWTVTLNVYGLKYPTPPSV